MKKGLRLLAGAIVAGAIAVPLQASAECLDNPPNIEGCYSVDPSGDVSLDGWYVDADAAGASLYHEHASVADPTFPFVHGDHDVYTDAAYLFQSYEVSPAPYLYANLVTNDTCHEVYVDSAGNYYAEEC